MTPTALALLAAVLAAVPPAAASAQQLPTLLDATLKAPRPANARVVRYGPAPSQFAELTLPAGPGPHPVVALVHGGCWHADVASIDEARPAAADLVSHGFAVWNIEYRRLGEPGAGFPGTYQDIAAALDALPAQARAARLDLARVVLLGHSAGSHLALWGAARARLPAASPLHVARPLAVKGVVAVGPAPSLEAMAYLLDATCGPGTRDALVGAKSPARPDPFADTSPDRLLPTGVPSRFVVGLFDGTTPPYRSWEYVRAAQKAGDASTLTVVPDASHLEVVVPGTHAWAAVVAAVQELAR